MKKLFGITLAAAFVFSLLMVGTAEAGDEVTKTGWITCTMCKGKVKEHASEGGCKMKCLEHGAKLAFYDNKSELTFVIENTEEAKKFHHKEVEVTGVFDAENKTVTLASLKMVKSEKGAKGESSPKKKCPHHKHE